MVIMTILSIVVKMMLLMLTIMISLLILTNNDNNNSNKNGNVNILNAFQLMMSGYVYELGACRTRFVFPEQPVLCRPK